MLGERKWSEKVLVGFLENKKCELQAYNQNVMALASWEN